jgi:uncharacterized membrane protein YeaQ/YmgE (transglycosylase-associated protein family)
MKKYLAAVNPLGKPLGGKSTDVFVGAALGLALSGLLKKFVVDKFFPQTAAPGTALNTYWPIVGSVLAGATLASFGKKVPGLNKMNQNALAAGAVAAAAAPFVYNMIAQQVLPPALSDTVEVALNGVIIRDGVAGYGLMANDAAPRLNGAPDFSDLAAMSMTDDDDDGLADLVAVNF